MDKSNKLIRIISAYLNNEKTDVSIDDEFLKLVHSQQMEALVYVVTKDPRLEKANGTILFAYANRKKLIEEIEKILNENNISYFWVKGMEVARYYKDSYLKTMGDSDLTVHPEDKKKVADLLLNHGYSEKKDNQLTGTEWKFRKQGLLFELHHALIYGEEGNSEYVNDPVYLEYFSHCWDYVKDNKLDDSYHLLYLFIHLRKHFMNSGAGIRQILDIAMFSKADINWKWFKEELIKLDLLSFSEKIYGLIYAWWGIRYPLTVELNKEFVEAATKTMSEGGVFGGFGANETVLRVNKGQSLLLCKIRAAFPSYKFMCHAGKYNGIIGRPYLLPFYWIYRVYIHRHDYKNTKAVKSVLMNNEDIKERTKVLEDWGLYKPQ